MNDSLKFSLNRYYSGRNPAAGSACVATANDIDRFGGSWKEHIAAAKKAWGLLGENELLKSEGRKSNLTWLLQGRYTMSSPDADNQVETFMRECGV